jgi:hypothetical protein
MTLRAQGAKCKSLGHRPREMEAVAMALKARNFRLADKLLLAIQSSYLRSLLCRALSAFYLRWPVLGRCPRLLHSAPLALSSA